MTSKGILTFEDWKELYEKLFGNVRASHHLLDMSVEMETRREDGLKSIAVGIKSMWLYMTNPEARKIIDEGRNMMSFQGKFGYGLFVSHKRGSIEANHASMPTLAVIGGTGIYEMAGISLIEKKLIATRYGEVKVSIYATGGEEFAFLPGMEKTIRAHIRLITVLTQWR